MQPDFESVIERKIHAWFNYMEGVMHTGQRNQFRIRISKEAYEKGLRLTHFGRSPVPHDHGRIRRCRRQVRGTPDHRPREGDARS